MGMEKPRLTKSKFIELLNAQIRQHPQYEPSMQDYQPQNGGMGYIWPDSRATYLIYVEAAGQVHAQYSLEK